MALFARLFIVFFCTVVFSNFILLHGGRPSVDLTVFVNNPLLWDNSTIDYTNIFSRSRPVEKGEDTGKEKADNYQVQPFTKNDHETNIHASLQQNKKGSSFLTMYGEHRVKHAIESLPKWLQDYFAWHRRQTGKVSPDTKYLVISCIGPDKCGGFSDRLRPLAFFLFVASRVDRVICIYWARPFGLDRFLKPLPSGIDWRCPADFEPLVNKTVASRWQTKFKHHILYYGARKYSGVEVAREAITTIRNDTGRFYSIGFKHQDFAKIDATNMVFHAHTYKDRMPVANAWIHVPLMEHIFRAMFEPIEPIARSINGTMTRYGLVENQYTSVHVRAKYPTHELTKILGDDSSIKHDLGAASIEFSGPYKDYIVELGRNALECGMLLKPSNKLFFSSDSPDLTKYITDNPFILGNGTQKYTIVGINSRDEIQHLEQSRHSENLEVSHVEFYPIVEDLLIMGGSQCVAHGVGSFGAFGAGLAGNRCRAIHRAPNGKPEHCPNIRGNNLVVNITVSDLLLDDKISLNSEGLLPPAKELILYPTEVNIDPKEAKGDEKTRDETEGSPYLTMYGEHRVESSISALPEWLRAYFLWHRQQTANTALEPKYMALTCLKRDKCGGFSDRLRALPFWLLLASKVNRVLCIYWSKPFGLDWFLQPLPNGIDWRCPKEFSEEMVDINFPSKFQRNYPHVVLFNRKPSPPVKIVTLNAIKRIKSLNDKYVSVSFKDQDFGKIDDANMVFHASSYKDTIPIANAWMHVPLMEHIFRVMFEPIEPIARRINATMAELGLVENEYTSVHVRARYPTMKMARIMGKMESREHDKHDKKLSFEGEYKDYLLEIASNALECGMLLEPHNKIFFSSDSTDLTKYLMNNPISIPPNDFNITHTQNATYRIVAIDSRDEIKHLEHGHYSSHIEYYPLIEDLLIMGGSRCVSHGIGSFGAFGAGLSGNRCRAIHRSPMGPISHCPNDRADNFVTNETEHFLLGDEGEGRLSPATYSSSFAKYYQSK
jgi:hypothetical protein